MKSQLIETQFSHLKLMELIYSVDVCFWCHRKISLRFKSKLENIKRDNFKLISDRNKTVVVGY